MLATVTRNTAAALTSRAVSIATPAFAASAGRSMANFHAASQSFQFNAASSLRAPTSRVGALSPGAPSSLMPPLGHTSAGTRTIASGAMTQRALPPISSPSGQTQNRTNILAAPGANGSAGRGAEGHTASTSHPQQSAPAGLDGGATFELALSHPKPGTHSAILQLSPDSQQQASKWSQRAKDSREVSPHGSRQITLGENFQIIGIAGGTEPSGGNGIGHKAARDHVVKVEQRAAGPLELKTYATIAALTNEGRLRGPTDVNDVAVFRGSIRPDTWDSARTTLNVRDATVMRVYGKQSLESQHMSVTTDMRFKEYGSTLTTRDHHLLGLEPHEPAGRKAQ